MIELDYSLPAVRTIRLETAEVDAAVRAAAETPGMRMADLFAAVEGDDLVLRAVFADDTHAGYQILEWPVRGSEYPCLSDHLPAAFVEECEIYEQFGVRPSGDKPLNRMLAPPHPHHGVPGPHRQWAGDAREVRAPHYVAGDAIEFPFGPVRAAAQESLYMGIVTSGEEVVDLYLLQWHKHRGIEGRLELMTPDRALFWAERAEGLSAVGNGWAFCQAVERPLGAAPPAAVERARAVALELERLYNHAAAIAALAQATGLSVGQAQAEIALEELLRINAATAGHRYLFGVLAVGGLNRPIETEVLTRRLPSATAELRRVIDALMSTNSFMDRLEATGIVGAEAAETFGLVGPVGRGSGQNIDTRRDHAFGPYRGLDLSVSVRSSGDVLARMEVMIEEIAQSRRLVDELIGAGVASGAVDAAGSGPASGLGWCESPRGESLAWVALDERGRIRRVRLRPASARNWRAFDDAARSRNVFTDIPIIEASFWLTVAGFAC